MPATSLSSIMLQVCSVIIIPRMIRVNEQTAHVVIVSCAIALVPGIFTHLKPELVKRRSQFLVAPSVVQNVQENGSNGPFRRDINGHWSDHSSSPSFEINPWLAGTETRAKTGEPETERSSNETRPIYRDFSRISTFRPEFHYFLLSLSLLLRLRFFVRSSFSREFTNLLSSDRAIFREQFAPTPYVPLRDSVQPVRIICFPFPFCFFSVFTKAWSLMHKNP